MYVEARPQRNVFSEADAGLLFQFPYPETTDEWICVQTPRVAHDVDSG